MSKKKATKTKGGKKFVPSDDFILPARLDKMIDHPGVGAFLKNLEDDSRAVIVDYVPDKGPIIVKVKDEVLQKLEGGGKDCDEPRLPDRPEDYVVLGPVGHLEDWLVLEYGTDGFLLVE